MVGKSGRTAVWEALPGLISDFRLDFVIVNGENAAGGFGITPKIWGYLDRDENPDIHEYRGYGELGVRFGRDDGFLAQLRLRHSTKGGSTQLDLSYPLSRAILSDTASYLHFQVFHGYGETLLDYNRSRGTQFRIGFSIQR